MLTRLSIAALLLCSAFAQPPQRKSDYPLINSRIVTVHGVINRGSAMPPIPAGPNAGKRLQDSCMISFTLKPGERAIEARGKSAVRTTATGCELEMEVGQPPEDQIEPVHPPSPPPGAQIAAKRPQPPSFFQRVQDSVVAWFHISSPRLEPAHAQSISAGYAVGWVTDPPGLWTTSEQANLNWFWSGGSSCPYVAAFWRTVPAYVLGWYNQWNFAVSPTGYCAGNPPFVVLGQAGGNVYSEWSNNVFPACGPPGFFEVDAFYQPVGITGDNFNNLTGNMSWAINGPPCIYLLTPNFQLVRTWG